MRYVLDKFVNIAEMSTQSGYDFTVLITLDSRVLIADTATKSFMYCVNGDRMSAFIMTLYEKGEFTDYCDNESLKDIVLEIKERILNNRDIMEQYADWLLSA